MSLLCFRGRRDETNLVEVDAHTLELELGGTVVNTIAVETVLARDGLPESSTDLVTLLTLLASLGD